MSKQLFRVGKGLDDGFKYYLSGPGVPGNDSDVQDNAPVGSQYQDTTSGNFYIKLQPGSGQNKWSVLATQSSLDSLVTGISWREPVVVTDTTSLEVATAKADLDADNQMQGHTVQVGDRILLAKLTTGANVYIVGGSAGNWTLTEDTSNASTGGDSVQTLKGDNLGKMFTYYDGQGWNWSASLSTSEDHFIRQFIGKGAAGTEMPSYTSVNYIATNDSLEVAAGKLDAQIKVNSDAIGALQTSASNVQTEVDAIETAMGAVMGTNGTYVAHTTSNYINGNSTVTGDLLDLDAAIKTNADALSAEITNRAADVDAEETRALAAESALQAELDATQAGAGLGTGGAYTANNATNYLKTVTTLVGADEALDAQLKVVSDLVASNNTAIQTEVNNLETSTGMNADGTFSAYTGTNYINAATSMKNADVLLDAAIKANADALATEITNRTADVDAEETRALAAEAALQSELDATQTGAGLGTDGTYTANGSANYISTANSLKDADNKLDTALKAEETARIAADNTLTTNLATEVTNRTNADSALQTELDASQLGAGLETNGTYAADATTNYLSAATSLKDADKKLDTQLKTVADLVASNNSAIQTEVNNLETSTGMNADGTFSAYSGTNYIDAATSMKNADVLLDAAIKAEETARVSAVSTEVTNRTNADAAIQSELDALETSVGSIVAANGTWVGVTGTNYLNAVTTITGALTALDTQLGSSSAAIQAELDTTQATLGTATNGTLAAWGGTNTYVTGSTTFKAGIDALDVQLKTVTDGLAAEITNRTADVDAEETRALAAELVLRTHLDALEASTGMNVDGTFSAYSGTNYMDSATSMKGADILLDTELKAVNTRVGNLQYSSVNLVSLSDSVTVAIGKLDAALSSSVQAISSNGITTATAVDSVPVDDYSVSKWIVTATQVNDETKKETAVVMGVHNGTPGQDATVADYTIFGQLRTNGEISGLNYTVELNGTGTGQTLQLKVASTSSVNVRATRLRVAI